MWVLDCEESWAPKNWCFWTVVLEKTLVSPLDCKEIQPVHPKGDQSWVLFGRTDGKAETPVLWPPYGKIWLIGKDSDAGRDWGQKEKGTTEDEMAGWHHRLDGHAFGWILEVGDGQGGQACCDSWGRKESDTTERLNWTELNWYICSLPLESPSHLPPHSTPLGCYRAPVQFSESYRTFPSAICFTYGNTSFCVSKFLTHLCSISQHFYYYFF